MYKIFLLTIIVLVAGCKEDPGVGYFSSEKAISYFERIKETTAKDDGKLWGQNLYGPIMYVDQVSRTIYANMPDEEGLLKEKDGIYTGIYPKEKVINNIAVEYGGTLFAMANLPSREDDYRIYARAVHGLFHVFQAKNNLDPGGYNTLHMNEPKARLWLKLEWKALEAALMSDSLSRQLSLRDALIFRGARHEYYPGMVKEEVKFEDYEGLATFTYTLLCTENKDEFRTRLIEYMKRTYENQSYVYSFGFIHGALYAYLLHDAGFDFRKINTPGTDLAALSAEAYNIQLPDVCRDVAGSIAVNYNLEQIKEEENKRQSEMSEVIRNKVGLFMEKPVVYIELISPSFSYEPEDINSLDTLGTLYSSIRVSDDWGKITVDAPGCLVSNNLKFLRITAKGFKEEKNHYWGDGWHLMLNDSWQIVKVDQNLFIRRLMP